jgi:hypothetical protein
VGPVLGHIQDCHVYHHVGVEVAAQVAVEEFQAAVGELVGEKAAGEADLGVEGLEGMAQGGGVKADFGMQKHREGVFGRKASVCRTHIDRSVSDRSR